MSCVMASALPSYDITDMLSSLMAVISKYEEKDPENPPNEGDYLLAMNTLKALNDRKERFSSVQRQVVVNLRERIRRVPNLLEITTRHANWMLKKLQGYITCEVCGSQVVNEYALTRHKKRAGCRNMKARVFFFSAKFQARKEKWDAKGYEIDFPFVAAMFQIHEDTKPQILVLPECREYVAPQQMVPRRLLPSMLWESMWSATAQNVNPKFCFRYEPNMFCYRLKRDGKFGYSKLFRQSIITQASHIHIPKVEEQLRTANVALDRPTFFDGWANGIQPRNFENWRIHHADRRPLIQMTIAPVKTPRFSCFPEIMNSVAGATPRTSFPAELANFSTILPGPSAPNPEPAPGLAQQPAPHPDSGDDDGNESDDDVSD